MTRPVALISAPMIPADMPSFQLALLKPTLERAGIPVQNFSLYLYFAAMIGWKLNDTLAMVRPSMTGEWIWAKAAFGSAGNDQDYLNHYQRNLKSICQEADCSLEDIIQVRNKTVFQFLDFFLKATDWTRFSLVGFSVTFQQLSASVALARALKAQHPTLPIIFGGATFEDDIARGVMQGCSCIDYIHCGDADVTLPEIIHKLDQGESLDQQKGLMWRTPEGEIIYAGRAPNLKQMDQTPIPDFDEYFYASEVSHYDQYSHKKSILLPIETGRGCWWGHKSHCTFCGLNSAGMEFRAKSPDNVLTMVESLTRRYGAYTFDAIDNIMSTDYVERLFGHLHDRGSDIEFHYEVRPYFKRDQLRDLRRGGLVSVQPGIETLSTSISKRMGKYLQAIQNVEFIKWCTYYGINNLYNILYGFKGETQEEYVQQCKLILKLGHFQPPYAITQARPDRGSPMFTQPDKYGLKRLEPAYCYQHIFPEERFDLKQVAYYYDFTQGDILPQRHYDTLHRLVLIWQQSWQQAHKPSLTYFRSVDSLTVMDKRDKTGKDYLYKGICADLYRFCDIARSEKAILKQFPEQAHWLRERLEVFVAHDLMIYLDERYLSLALPVNRYQ